MSPRRALVVSFALSSGQAPGSSPTSGAGQLRRSRSTVSIRERGSDASRRRTGTIGNFRTSIREVMICSQPLPYRDVC